MRVVYTSLKKQLSWEDLDLVSLLNYFRYCSLLVTSFFYFMGPPFVPFYLKAGASFCLFLEAFVFIRVYKENEGRWVRKLLIFMETIGLAFILILTGGLDSPFLWYAINPILLAVTLLPVYFCWAMVAVFLSCALFLQRFTLYGPENALPLWPNRSIFFLIFFLSTFAAQIFNYLIRRLSRQAKIMEKQLNHIKSLYEAIEVFSHHNDPQEVANLFASYSRTLTGANKVIVWVEGQFGANDPLKKNFYSVRGPMEVLSEDSWYPYIKRMFEERKTGQEIDIHRLPSGSHQGLGTLITVKVKSSSNIFGVLSAYYLNNRENMDEVKNTLTFLADLCAGALEKRFLESLAEEFLLVEEKDRIAGEIHDSVTQNIFGLVYGLDMLIKKETLDEAVRMQLKLLQKTAQRSLRDLRLSIYCMSTLKSKTEPFVEEVKKYLTDLGQLNNVDVKFSCNDGFGPVNSLTRKSLYRIIREATGNAIRHGGCDSIQVFLKSHGNKLKLTVADNGCGFEPTAVEQKGKFGLGLVNMKELARNIGGELTIESVPGKGTVISCEIPQGQERKVSSGERRG